MSRILIVDDDAALAKLMAIVLGRDGHEAVTAGSLQEARTQAGPFDLIVADVRLPNGDGRHLRQDWPAVPMLMISGAPVDEPAEVSTGAFPFLAKPFHSRHLQETVRGMLEAP